MSDQLVLRLGDEPDRLIDAVTWRADNPVAFAQVVEWHDEDVRHGGQPCIDLYGHLLRRPWFAHKLGLLPSDESYLVNNSLLAAVARLCNRDHGCEFPTRKSRLDEEEE